MDFMLLDQNLQYLDQVAPIILKSNKHGEFVSRPVNAPKQI